MSVGNESLVCGRTTSVTLLARQRTHAHLRPLRPPSGPVRNYTMQKFLLAFLLVSLTARAEERRLEAVRVDSAPSAATAPAPGDATSRDEASGRSAVPFESQRPSSEGSGLPIHVGAMVGLSLPRPLDAQLYVRAFGFVSVGFSYSDFPAFVADPLLSAAGLKNGQTTVRLDQFSAWEGDVRVFPFAGSFFVGSGLGRQSFKSSVTQSTTLGSYNGSVAVSTTYATPRIGYLWTVGPGVVLGMDAGVQLKLSSNPQVSLPPGAPADMQSQANRVVDVFGNNPLPSLHFRVGWQY
jgi:hypothetical protein